MRHNAMPLSNAYSFQHKRSFCRNNSDDKNNDNGWLSRTASCSLSRRVKEQSAYWPKIGAHALHYRFRLKIASGLSTRDCAEIPLPPNRKYLQGFIAAAGAVGRARKSSPCYLVQVYRHHGAFCGRKFHRESVRVPSAFTDIFPRRSALDVYIRRRAYTTYVVGRRQATRK